ncbi:hypothetical protein MSIMFI_00481 [Mycobacterium simulans]|uniref:class I SAM-dependent methyltransferase n=1 Tax=Mycobacterium simulans TaxID=627089 RepID=UPI00174D8D35|nr:methyltransferase domain-containing protein [Mycobacterium simulans]SON59000.1 hypothetical protein MSIMFI_00481 [Mycobacterium simulans]
MFDNERRIADQGDHILDPIAGVEYHRGNAEELPLLDNIFDALVCECAVCTFPDKNAAAHEFARIPRPGGLAGITDVTITELLESAVTAPTIVPRPWVVQVDTVASRTLTNERLCGDGIWNIAPTNTFRRPRSGGR